jgi:hypothetical protein
LTAKGDPDRDQLLAGLRQTIRDLPTGAVVLAEDETHFNLLPWVRASWIAHGQRRQVVTPGTNRRRSIFGAINLASGRFLYLVAHKAVSATFIAFLEQLASAYPAAPMVVMVICDKRHHPPLQAGQSLAGGPSQPAGAAGARYSPNDNPVERIWGALKAWLANSPTMTIQGRVRQVHAFFREAQPCPAAGHRSAAQLTLAARRLRAELPAGRLGVAPRPGLRRSRLMPVSSEGDLEGGQGAGGVAGVVA